MTTFFRIGRIFLREEWSGQNAIVTNIHAGFVTFSRSVTKPRKQVQVLSRAPVLVGKSRVNARLSCTASCRGSDDLRAAAAALSELAVSIAALVSVLQGKLANSQSHSLTPLSGPTSSNGCDGRTNHAQLPALASTAAPVSKVPMPDAATVTEAINTFLIAKARAGKSERYLRTMKNSLSKFARGRSQKLLDEVTVLDLEKWLAGSDWNGTTRHGYMRDVRTLYNFAVRRGLAALNPARAIDLPERTPAQTGIHTPEQVQKVLEAARKRDLNLCRALAVRYFAGLRSAECDRISEADIRLEQGLLEVRAHNAKTRRRRLVTIQPALKEWLALGGQLPLHDVGNRMRKFVASLDGIAWPHNVTRHSFCSYHLAHFGSASKTALEAGHSEAMLFGHYRALVTPKAAEEFWEIRPAHGGGRAG